MSQPRQKRTFPWLAFVRCATLQPWTNGFGLPSDSGLAALLLLAVGLAWGAVATGGLSGLLAMAGAVLVLAVVAGVGSFEWTISVTRSA